MKADNCSSLDTDNAESIGTTIGCKEMYFIVPDTMASQERFVPGDDGRQYRVFLKEEGYPWEGKTTSHFAQKQGKVYGLWAPQVASELRPSTCNLFCSVHLCISLHLIESYHLNSQQTNV